ncbi:MAG: hypothetical protein JEZ03_17905 [Bacteroidales bacterium]|nr:hypothetical protein [Bacteroidales bacterium]
MSSIKKTNNIKIYILYFVILTSFMDAYPVLPTVYKPIAIFYIAPFFLIFIFKNIRNIFLSNRSFSLFFLLYLLYFLYGFFISIFFSRYDFYNYDGIIDYTLTFSIGIFSFYFYFVFFKSYAQETIDKAFDLIGKLVVSIGFVEILTMLGIVPQTVEDVILTFFRGSGYGGRIVLINNEPAWAANTLMVFLAFFHYKKNKWFVLLIQTELLLSFSLKGYIMLFIFEVVRLLFIEKNYKSFFLLIIIIVLTIFFVNFLLLPTLSFFGFENTHFGRRFLLLSEYNLNFESIKYVLVDRGSGFVRIMYPYVGFLMFIDNPIGWGGGNYRFLLGDYIYKYPYAKFSGEVNANVELLNGNPKNIFSRALSENGLLGFIIIIILSINIGKKAKRQNNKLFQYFVLSLFCIFLQFDSYAYLPLYLILGLLYSRKNNNFNDRRLYENRI